MRVPPAAERASRVPVVQASHVFEGTFQLVGRAPGQCYGAAPSMHLETFEAGPLGCNCSIVMDPESKRAIVVDPGGDFDVISARLDALGAQVDAIVHTHTHIDHVGATKGVQEKTRARACIHEGDRFLYDLLPVQAAMLGIALPPVAEMEGSLADGGAIHAGALEMGILHTPGHTRATRS
jgi:glyoxylase-like metal-dependent hydrolase (beta-lactamase superfamily II)